jgi:hypothetical protein
MKFSCEWGADLGFNFSCGLGMDFPIWSGLAF